jgi:hypothetical protein
MEDKTPIQESEFEMVALQVPFTEDESIYSNASAMALTAMDLRISFAEARQDKTVKPKATIVMPIEHAAIICLNLLNILASFERNTGPIRNPQWQHYFAGGRATAVTEAELAKSGQIPVFP